MRAFLPFVVAGITSGALYGLAAVGLVVTYKTSGIFNFAHGAIGAAAAYLFHELWQVRGQPWPVSAAVTVLVFAPVLGLALELVARRLAGTDPASRIVATIGLLLVIQGVATVIYGPVALDFRPFFPDSAFRLAGVAIGWDQLLTFLIASGCVAGLFVLFRRTLLGLELRAVVDDSALLGLTGASPVAVRRAAWVIGSCFAALSGVLLAPSVGLEAGILTLLVVQAFGAAAVGRFSRVGTTFAAGIGIGVGAALLTKYVPSYPALAGLPSSLPFVVLFAVLVFSPAGRFAAREPRRRPVRGVALGRAALPAAVAAGLVVAALPALVGAKLPVYTSAAISVTVFVSLSLLVGLSGQVSLCHATFVAIGATTFSHLTAGAGLPWAAGVAGAALVVVPVGALLALPAIRLSGLYLALATFGFGLLVERVAFGTAVMFGAEGARTGARPDVLALAGDRGFFYLCAAVAAGAVLLSLLVRRSRLGRLLRGLADSPVVLATNGANANTTRLLVFCLSAMLAAVAGALSVSLYGSVNGAGYTTFQSLTLLAVLAIAGRGAVTGPVVAAVLLTVLPSYVTTPDVGSWTQIGFGAVAVAAACSDGSWRAWVGRRAAASAGRRRTSPVRARARVAAGAEVAG